MNDQINHPDEEQSIGERLKSRFGRLDPFIPPALPFEQIEGAARVARAESARSGLTRRRGATPHFRASAGASVALVGLAAVLVLVLGSGAIGPRRDLGGGASAAPSAAASGPARTALPVVSSGCSTYPTQVAVCASVAATAAASPIASGSAAGSPLVIFSQAGSGYSWSPSRTRIAFTTDTSKPPVSTKIIDLTGRTIDTVQASAFLWVDDNTYLGFNGVGGAMRGFMGRIGIAAQEALPGTYAMSSWGGGAFAAGGVAALPVDGGYVVWTAAGLSATRSGSPVDISPDGTLIAVGQVPETTPPSFEIVRTDSGSVVYTYPGAPWLTTTFGFSPDGRKFAFQSYRGDDAHGRVGIVEIASGSSWIADPCTTQQAEWLDDTHLRVASGDTCVEPLDSGVSITTPPDWSAVTSSGGTVASVAASPDDPVEVIRVAIDAEGGMLETLNLSGRAGYATLSWSSDGSVLIVEYTGLELVTPPQYVVMIRP
jgi:hypothetical protein